MKLIVGLGNPGEQYEKTRHNLGFMVIEQFFKDFETVQNTIWTNDRKLKSDIVLLDWQPKKSSSERIILTKPKTYMNNSGMAVQLIASYYKVDARDIWIVHDDLDLPLGKMKIRFGGAAGGHHGVEDVIEKIGTDKFWRFRLGIGQTKYTAGDMDEDGGERMVIKRDMGDANEFVLGAFKGKENSEAKKLVRYASNALEVALEKGLDCAMNRFNTK
jgi:peptidyl-tRNA hydrolase, PTH1 family